MYESICICKLKVYVCIYVYMYVSMYVFMYVYMYVCDCVYRRISDWCAARGR